MPRIYLYVYCKEYNGVVSFMRAYKYQTPKKDTTPSCSMFMYSDKSKRYHETYIYFMDWFGEPMQVIPDSKMFRYAVTRIGLDVR
ncbi:MAG: hypothetical protein [Caudoviricetes sp.]|nr:MAG: hypothetical protein [Caudoviricetes sp.]